MGFLTALAGAAWADVPLEVDLTIHPRLERTDTVVHLMYDVAEGLDYEVQAADELGAGAWVALPDAPHNGGRVSISAPTARRFFRALERGGERFVPLRIDTEEEYRTNGVDVIVRRYIPQTMTGRLEEFDLAQGDWKVVTDDFLSLEMRYYAGVLEPPPLRVMARLRDPLRLFEAIMVGGQSNALMYDDLAYPEKVDATFYVDANFRYVAPARRKPEATPLYTYNFATAAAIALADAVPKKRLLIPVAVGGTALSQWLPGTNRLAANTLFGQANMRWALSAPQGLTAIWWYGHESSASVLGNATYEEDWGKLVTAWREEAGPVPILYAQIGRAEGDYQIEQMHITAEHQRRTETNWPAHHMVVAFDLPLADHVHLSADAYEVLGARFALAMRQHVYGEAIDGTGPRPMSAAYASPARDRILVRFSTPINACIERYDEQFRVFENGTPLPIAFLERDKTETGVLIQLAAPPVGECAVDYGGVVPPALNQFLTNVVRGANGLPSPQFGPILVAEMPGTPAL